MIGLTITGTVLAVLFGAAVVWRGPHLAPSWMDPLFFRLLGGALILAGVGGWLGGTWLWHIGFWLSVAITVRLLLGFRRV